MIWTCETGPSRTHMRRVWMTERPTLRLWTMFYRSQWVCRWCRALHT